jgi:hypothetical protein
VVSGDKSKAFAYDGEGEGSKRITWADFAYETRIQELEIINSEESNIKEASYAILRATLNEQGITGGTSRKRKNGTQRAKEPGSASSKKQKTSQGTTALFSDHESESDEALSINDLMNKFNDFGEPMTNAELTRIAKFLQVRHHKEKPPTLQLLKAILKNAFSDGDEDKQKIWADPLWDEYVTEGVAAKPHTSTTASRAKAMLDLKLKQTIEKLKLDPARERPIMTPEVWHARWRESYDSVLAVCAMAEAHIAKYANDNTGT